MSTTQESVTAQQLAARQILASALAGALADPRGPLARRVSGGDLQIIEWAWAEIIAETAALHSADLGIGERLPRDVSVQPLIDWLDRPITEREAVHQHIFGLVMAKLCPAYETEYCASKDTTHRSQELADISGFYRAFGVGPSRELPERFDHVSLEIEFLGLLIEKQRCATLESEEQHVEVCCDAHASFIRDHAGWWIPTFGRLLEKRVNDLAANDQSCAVDMQCVAGVARVLCAWLAVERSVAGVAPPRRLISPNMAVDDSDDDCDSCGTCSHASNLS